MTADQNQYAAGIHAVRHALQSEQDVLELIIEKGKRHPRINELIHLAKQKSITVRFLPAAALERMGDNSNHQGALARINQQTNKKVSGSLQDWLKTLEPEDKPLLLLLDQVTDPHNLGACLRSAEAAACSAVIIPKNNAADLHSPTVSKTACGAASRLPVFTVNNLCRAIELLQANGFWIFGLAGEGEHRLFDVDFQGRSAMVLGAEDKGLRRLVREHCDQLLHIPMPGHMESLNVSVAAGITLFEVVRQRLQPVEKKA